MTTVLPHSASRLVCRRRLAGEDWRQPNFGGTGRALPARRTVAAGGAGAGFSLLELMVAIAILGIVMTMLAGAFHAVAMSKTHAERRLADDRAARAILWQLTNELRASVQTPLIASHVLFIGSAGMENFTPVDSVTFSTLNPAHRLVLGGFGSEEIVSYNLVPNRRHRAWHLLYRSQQSALVTGNYNPQDKVLLASNVLSFHLRYFNGRTWSESWDSRSMPPGLALPQAVALDLLLDEGGARPRLFSTLVTLPMAMARW